MFTCRFENKYPIYFNFSAEGSTYHLLKHFEATGNACDMHKNGHPSRSNIRALSRLQEV